MSDQEQNGLTADEQEYMADDAEITVEQPMEGIQSDEQSEGSVESIQEEAIPEDDLESGSPELTGIEPVEFEPDWFWMEEEETTGLELSEQTDDTESITEVELVTSHASHVRNLALVLFDSTRMLHDLKENSRDILETAALLHDVALPPRKKKSLQATRELIQKHAPDEFAPEEHKVLAAVLAYHHGKIGKKDFLRLDLSPIQQRETLTIAALLRIAAGLDESRSGATTIQKVDPAPDEMWIVVDGPEASLDASAAKRNANLWVKIGYPQIMVMEPREAAIKMIPFPEPKETIGITPEDTLAEAGRKVMLFHFSQMLRHEEGTQLGEDIEALHDMRVATRRMRAAFEVFGDAFEPRALKPYLKGLRATGRALGNVRDLDVFMEKAKRYLDTLPLDHRADLDPLLQTWEQQREAARDKMLNFLEGQEYHAFKRKFNIFLHSPGAGARSLPQDAPSPSLVAEMAPVLIYTRLAAVRAFNPWLDDAPIERLHALRIEFKKLRYTVEYFREVLGMNAGAVIENLKRIQDHLGDLNDAQVATEILREFIDEWEPQQEHLPISERVNLEAVVTYLATRHAERHRLMVTFKDSWEQFNQPEFRRHLAMAVAVL